MKREYEAYLTPKVEVMNIAVEEGICVSSALENPEPDDDQDQPRKFRFRYFFMQQHDPRRRAQRNTELTERLN